MVITTIKRQISTLDVIGVSASGICAIHCLAMPLLLPVLAASNLKFVTNGWFEITVMMLSLSLAFYSITHSFLKKHKNAIPFVFLALSFGLFLNRNTFGFELHTGVVIAAGICIITAYIVNWHLCKSCPVCSKCSEN